MHLKNEKSFINDISTELINSYEIIRDNPYELMAKLDEHSKKHENGLKEYYYEVRKMDRLEDWESISKIDKAARMIYLNKTCFNGLYRVNRKGQFNVPFNNRKKVNTYDKLNLLNLSKYLKENVTIYNKDFEEACEEAVAGDFIYFDPPYDLLNGDTFESYTKEGFGVEGQKRLAELTHSLEEKGCYVMISNHNTELINEIYSNYNIAVVSAKRMINSDANNRTGEEVIITTY